jgi:hypothetical protein
VAPTEWAFVQSPPGLIFIATVAIMPLMFLLTSAQWLRSSVAWRDPANWYFAEPNLAVSSIAGLFVTIGLYDCASFIRSERASDVLLILGGVSVASIAYGMQFVSSQLSWAEEMRGYEDTLTVFRRARSALKELDADLVSTDRRNLRHTIIHALGKEALKENESWLRTHRERPLEPLPPA